MQKNAYVSIFLILLNFFRHDVFGLLTKALKHAILLCYF